MDKILAIIQLLGALLLAIIAGATIHNLWNISMRPETISVVNAIVGQGVGIICLCAMATVLFRKGWKALNSAASDDTDSES